MTANEVTKAAIAYLNLRGCFVWRQNNTTPTRGRTFIGKKGVTDICGITKDGRGLYVEVKVGRDKQSEEQKQFAVELYKRKAIYLVISHPEELIKAGL